LPDVLFGFGYIDEKESSHMNKKWVLASSILAIAVVHASGQASGGGGGTGGGGTTGGGTTGGATTSSGQSSTTVNSQTGVQNPQNPQQQPGMQNRNQLPPGSQNRQQLPPGTQGGQIVPPTLAGRTNFTAGFTNQAAFTNGAFTNQFAGTNRFGTNMSPTGRGTNHVFSTNHFDFRHFDRNRFRDEAITPGDQTLLIRIRQTIITQISVSTGGGNFVPIHCSIHSGHVRLMGLVRSMDEAQRLLATVSGMPGVTGVENGLSTLPQDQAASENDRVILAQIRQFVPLSQPPAPWTPVSFDVRQGAVGIAGIVPTTQESQRIESTVRQVPGVVQTSNTLIVDASVSTGATPTSTVPR
jgi:osmotically-inducible protein OsmY